MKFFSAAPTVSLVFLLGSGKVLSMLKDYDFSKSTEDNHSLEDDDIPEQLKFIGKYGGVRKQLDYSYHKHYSFERQQMHDELIDRFLETIIHDGDLVCDTPFQNWLVFTAGCMGAGKGRTIAWLSSQNLFPFDAFVKVDPDALRELLPEMKEYHARDRYSAGHLTQKEVGYIAEVLTIIALDLKKNVLVDGSLRNSAWWDNHICLHGNACKYLYLQYINKLRSTYPAMKIAIIYVTAREETILARVKKRAEHTGRFVPDDVIHNTLKELPTSLRVLAPHVDFFAAFENEAATPRLLKFSKHTRRHTNSNTTTTTTSNNTNVDIGPGGGRSCHDEKAEHILPTREIDPQGGRSEGHQAETIGTHGLPVSTPTCAPFQPPLPPIIKSEELPVGLDIDGDDTYGGDPQKAQCWRDGSAFPPPPLANLPRAMDDPINRTPTPNFESNYDETSCDWRCSWRSSDWPPHDAVQGSPLDLQGKDAPLDLQGKDALVAAAASAPCVVASSPSPSPLSSSSSQLPLLSTTNPQSSIDVKEHRSRGEEDGVDETATATATATAHQSPAPMARPPVRSLSAESFEGGDSDYDNHEREDGDEKGNDNPGRALGIAGGPGTEQIAQHTMGSSSSSSPSSSSEHVSKGDPVDSIWWHERFQSVWTLATTCSFPPRKVVRSDSWKAFPTLG